MKPTIFTKKQLLITSASAGTNVAAVTYLAIWLSKLICRGCSDDGIEALSAAMACLFAVIIRFIRARWNITLPS